MLKRTPKSLNPNRTFDQEASAINQWTWPSTNLKCRYDTRHHAPSPPPLPNYMKFAILSYEEAVVMSDTYRNTSRLATVLLSAGLLLPLLLLGECLQVALISLAARGSYYHSGVSP